MCFEPFGRGFFYVFDDRRKGNSAVEGKEDVDVVFDRIECEDRRVEVLEDGRQVGVEVGTNEVGEERFSMFGGENEVNEVGGEGLRHGEGRPFRAWVCCCRI